MNIKTKLTKIGRDQKKNKGYINPGIYKGSTLIFNDFKSYVKDRDRKDDAAYYGININPTCNKFERAISKLYGASHCSNSFWISCACNTFFYILEKW